MDNKILKEVINGEFKSGNITYVVIAVTSEISNLTKKGSSNFSMLGKVVFEEDNNSSKLIAFTDKDSAFVINNATPIYMSFRDLKIEALGELPELIKEAEIDKTSLVKQPAKPTSIVVKQEPLDNIEFGAFLTSDSGLQVIGNKEGTGLDIVEFTSTSIIDCKSIHHKVEQAFLIEYEDGTKSIVGIDINGHLVYTSQSIERNINTRLKSLGSGDTVKSLNRSDI